jgi:hypothetical protein
MTDKLFDDFFKEKLEHHDSGAPMHVWEKVRRELHEDDDDKVIAWWKNPLWLIALFLFAGGITTTGIVGMNKGWFTTTSPTVASTDTKQNNVESDNPSTNTSPKTTILNATKENDKTATSDKNISDAVTNQNQPAVTSINNSITSTNTSVISNHTQQNRFSINSNRKKSKRNFFRKILQSKQPSGINTVTSETKNDENDFSSFDLTTAFSDAEKKSTFKNLFEPQKLNAVMPIGLQSLNNCPTIGPPRRNDLYIEVYGSADNVTRSLSGTSFTPANYLDKRNEAEKNKVGFSAGIRISKNLGERTLLKTGINYSQINETLKYVNEKDIRIITVITIRTVTSGGQTITISDTTQVTQIGTNYTTFHNKYRTIDIPLIFGYELGDSRKFSLAVNAGVIINLSSVYKGKILDTNLNPVAINTNSTLGVNAWRKNIGLGLYASLNLSKRINNQMHLFFEPYTRINLNPVTVSKTVVSQKYTTSGIQVGVRYNLFHKRQRYIE